MQDTTTPESVPADSQPAEPESPVPVCGSCGRQRTLADDYDYTPMQLFTGRPLGWFNGDGEQMCGQCLTGAMSGAWPANHQANPEKTGP